LKLVNRFKEISSKFHDEHHTLTEFHQPDLDGSLIVTIYYLVYGILLPDAHLHTLLSRLAIFWSCAEKFTSSSKVLYCFSVWSLTQLTPRSLQQGFTSTDVCSKSPNARSIVQQGWNWFWTLELIALLARTSPAKQPATFPRWTTLLEASHHSHYSTSLELSTLLTTLTPYIPASARCDLTGYVSTKVLPFQFGAIVRKIVFKM